MVEAVTRLELLISQRRLRARIAALARRIDADYADRPLALVVVLKGAVVFAADLARRLATPATLDFVTAASYGSAMQSSGRVALDGVEHLGIAGRNVLLVEDILDSGLTSAALIDALHQRGPASLALCALLRKPAARGLALPAAYIGFDIADDFIVGYGMDHAERYRSLPAIYRLLLQ